MQLLGEKLKECGLFRFIPQTTPSRFVDIGWGGKESDNVALFGNRLPLSSCATKPTLFFNIFNFRDDSHFCFLAFDADRQDSATGCYLQWARFNVHGDLQYSTGRDSFRWQTPLTDENRDHRVFFLVLVQEAVIDTSAVPLIASNSTELRSDFDFRAFATKYKLTNFVGANCVRVGHDPEIVAKQQQLLRDKIEFDANGKVAIAEFRNGVRTPLISNS